MVKVRRHQSLAPVSLSAVVEIVGMVVVFVKAEMCGVTQACCLEEVSDCQGILGRCDVAWRVDVTGGGLEELRSLRHE